MGAIWTLTLRFSPGVSRFDGLNVSPSVNTWALVFDRLVISATTDVPPGDAFPAPELVLVDAVLPPLVACHVPVGLPYWFLAFHAPFACVPVMRPVILPVKA